MRAMRPLVITSFAFAVLLLEGRAANPLPLWPEKIESTQQWESKIRPEILRRMQQVMGPLPGNEKRCALDPQTEEEVDCGTYVRRLLTYQSEPGARVPAYLLVPKTVLDGKHKAHGVLCLHQTHPLGQKVVVGLGNSPNDEYGVELVQRGFVCIAPAYPLLASYAPDLKRLGYASGTMKAIWDNIRALDLLESLPYVEKGPFAAIGHSLGGHNSLFTAAFDPRIKVVVTSCGFDSFRDYMNGNIRGWTSERYMPKLLDYSAADRPFDFPQVLAAIAPHRIFVNAPLGDTNFKTDSVDEVCAAVLPIFKMYDAEKNLAVRHPDAGHLFPKELRAEAYQFIENAFK
jgi:hypothetical protein